MGDLADDIEARLREIGSPERAEGEKRYLKSDLEFIGVTLGHIRGVVRDVHGPLSHDELITVATQLWARPIFDRRLAAVMLLERFAVELAPSDLPLIERLVRESRTWALVDAIADDVLGRIVLAAPDGMVAEMDRWSADDDFWVRRSSVLCELRPIRKGQPLDRFLARADAMLEEREFFIRKAIGWVLREAGKRRPGEVAAWLGPRTHRASGVTMREAVKYLPADTGASLMEAYRRHEPATR
jgi:3-methyladenine DNA glycosylase AlkD